jgi:polar amino acid transport system substrate-binding protein
MNRLNRITGIFGAVAAMLAASMPAHAQTPPPTVERPAATAPDANPVSNPMAVPGFWDPRRRPERPDLSRIGVIRFLTETDYPPFDYAGPDGAPAGSARKSRSPAPSRCGGSIPWSMP